MSEEITVYEGKVVAVSDGQWSGRKLELIKSQIAKDCDDDELELFQTICRHTGLDPFQRQIYAIRRGGKMTVQTGIDGYRLIAARTGELAGIDDALYDTEDGENPNRATITVYRMIQGQRVPFTATARWREYAQYDKSGKLTDMWSRFAWLMLGKCAEALALRRAFPAELSGLYVKEEMDQAENPTPTPPVTVREQRTSAQATRSAKAPVSARSAPANILNPGVDDIKRALNDRITAIGISPETLGMYRAIHEVRKVDQARALVAAMDQPEVICELRVLDWLRTHQLLRSQILQLMVADKIATYQDLWAAILASPDDMLNAVREFAA